MKTKTAAFSLLELLVVMAIMLILLTLTGRAFLGVQQSFRLTQAGADTAGWLEFARKKALSANRLVEVRWIRATPDKPFRHLAIFVLAPNGERTLASRLFTLPDDLLFAEDPDLSPLLTLPAGSATEPIPGLGNSYSSVSFYFRPDGTTDLPWSPTEKDRFFVTVLSEREQTRPPVNFVAIEVDPLNGRTRTHRP